MKVSNRRGLPGETVKYVVSMPSPQLKQKAASIGTTPMPLKCIHHVHFVTNQGL